MFEQTFKNIDDVLWKEAGCTTELDYTEQTSWMLFLKYLDDLERANARSRPSCRARPTRSSSTTRTAGRAGRRPKKADGTFDHDKALTGDDLIEYVDRRAVPLPARASARAPTAPNTIEYKIGEIFGEIENKFRSGYSLRDALELVDAAALPVAGGEARALRSSTKPRSRTWATPAGTAANTTRRVR